MTPSLCRRNVWISQDQSWTQEQKCASLTVWSDSSTPASSSWTDWNRLRGPGAHFRRRWPTEGCPWNDWSGTSQRSLLCGEAVKPSQLTVRRWTVPSIWEKEQHCYLLQVPGIDTTCGLDQGFPLVLVSLISKKQDTVCSVSSDTMFLFVKSLNPRVCSHIRRWTKLELGMWFESRDKRGGTLSVEHVTEQNVRTSPHTLPSL